VNTNTTTIYQTNDGEDFEAFDALDLVVQMRAAAFEKEADVPAYMAAVARTVADATGFPIRSDDPEAFVDDLIKVGFLSVVEAAKEKI
jgi:hypothetical protein